MPKLDNLPDSLADAGIIPISTTIPTPAGPKILIVDDSPVDRRLASSIVARRGGLRVITASDGHEALILIAKERPDVIITDLQMPGMSGLELVEEVHRISPGTPVILMTAFGSEEIAVQALRAGATNYVPKKALAGELLATLDSVLSMAAVDHHRQKLLASLESRRSSFRLENDAELIAPLIAMLQEDLYGLLDANERTRMGVALQEAMANAIYHGNLEVSSDLRQEDEKRFYAEALIRRGREPYSDRRIEISSDLGPDFVAYTIKDEGPGFDTSKLDEPFDPESVMRIGGRGMLLIRTFMDEVWHNEIGNQITMVKRRKPL
ncbi:response regulator [Tundrisphaera lichenicola]|uniref:ATP-binding response regulator n=1 Tax=Tundrisphaera lichenicola TaxID=2029860 RepID=UPI003EB7472F